MRELTESSAVLLSRLPDDQRAAVLRGLFDPVTGAGISVLRVPMGASDFARTHYTYDDMPPGQTDPALSHFSVAQDDAAVVPVLREILQHAPDLLVVASPWSAPAWMKTSGRLGGGSLRPEWYDAWAQYFVRFIQAYEQRGISVGAVTVQNEPGYADPPYPTMTMSADEQATFVADHLGPAFAAAGLPTRIIGYDHNWDTPGYPAALLGDGSAGRYLSGVAWHCYRGSSSAQSQVHDRYPQMSVWMTPQMSVWMTECSGGDWHGSAAGSFAWLAEVVIAATRQNGRAPHCCGTSRWTPCSWTPRRRAVRSRSWPSRIRPARARALLRNRAEEECVVRVGDGRTIFTVTLPTHAVAALRWPT